MKTSSLDEKSAHRDVNTLFRFTAKSVQNATPFSASSDLKGSITKLNPSLDDCRNPLYARIFGTKVAIFCLILCS
jgi:hypothetical protein